MTVIIFALSCIISFITGVIIHDVHSFECKRYIIKNSKIKKSFSFALLSDLHGQIYKNNNEDIITAIEKYNPDFVIFAGDMVNVKYNLKYNAAKELIERLSGNYPVYYGIGNHEARLSWENGYDKSYSEILNMMENAGATILDNRNIHMNEYGLKLTGLNLPQKFYDKFHKENLKAEDIVKLVGKNSGDNINILVAHNPEYFDAYNEYGADLVLSGHLHGGIMRFPMGLGAISPRYQIFPKYCGGLYKKNKTKMFVSRGLGTHTIPVRVFNPGEISFIKIKKK